MTTSRVGNADEQTDRLNSELPCATRRALLLTAFTGYAILAAIESTKAEEESGSRRPQKADLLVRAEGDHAGEVIRLDDLRQGDAPLHAWPKDPKTSVVRDGSRLNEVIIVKLDPEELDEETRAIAVDGLVAYSVICTHAGCPITEWEKQQEGEKHVFKCMCHNSEFDPRRRAEVVFGPAPRRLAVLPLAVADGVITVAEGFVGKVGVQE